MKKSLKAQLKDIASVQMGYSFRNRLMNSASGNISVIQMKDLSERNKVDCRELVRIDMGGVRDHHIVKKGDLIFRSRGLTTTSAIVLEEREIMVVSAPLSRIRIFNTQQVYPQYLNWLIRQTEAQIFFTQRAKGTGQKMISINTLAEMPVSIPEMYIQREIVEISELLEKELKILNSLILKRKQLISQNLMQLAKGE